MLGQLFRIGQQFRFQAQILRFTGAAAAGTRNRTNRYLTILQSGENLR